MSIIIDKKKSDHTTIRNAKTGSRSIYLSSNNSDLSKWRNFSAALEYTPKHEMVATLVRGTACVSIKTPQQKFQDNSNSIIVVATYAAARCARKVINTMLSIKSAFSKYS